MKNYKTTKYERIVSSIKRSFPFIDGIGQKRMARSEFAHFLTRGRTIGRVNGELVIGDPDNSK